MSWRLDRRDWRWVMRLPSALCLPCWSAAADEEDRVPLVGDTPPMAYNCERHARWMSQLPDEVLELPLASLCLPGTHDSSTYGPIHVTKHLQGAPGFTSVVKQLRFFVHHNVNGWTQTHDTNTYEQLQHGMRFLDWRIAFCPSEDCFYGMHTFAGPKLDEMISDLLLFLSEYEHEVVFVRIQAYYETDVGALLQKLVAELGRFCMSRGGDDSTILCRRTLKDLMSVKERLVLLLPKVKMSELDRLLSDMPESEVDQIGRPGVAPASLVLPEGDLFHDRWIDTNDVDLKRAGLTKQLNEYIASAREGHSMFLAEWTLTPQAGHDIAKSMLVKRLMTYRSLKDMASTMNTKLGDWLHTLTPQQRAAIGVLCVDYESRADHVHHAIVLNLERAGLHVEAAHLVQSKQPLSVTDVQIVYR